MRKMNLAGWVNTYEIISDRVLGTEHYRRHVEIEKRKFDARRRRNQRNFKWFVLLILLGMGLLIYIEYGC